MKIGSRKELCTSHNNRPTRRKGRRSRRKKREKKWKRINARSMYVRRSGDKGKEGNNGKRIKKEECEKKK